MATTNKEWAEALRRVGIDPQLVNVATIITEDGEENFVVTYDEEAIDERLKVLSEAMVDAPAHLREGVQEVKRFHEERRANK